MPFDPSLPATNAPLESAVVRGQLQALFNLINAIVSVTGAQVQSTTTLNPGLSATASVTLDGSVLRFIFGIPRGNPGAPGEPFANAVVDGVSTLEPGDPAYVNVSFDGTDVHFEFGIPRGNDGADGADGSDGADGEVTQQALDDAISGTSANSNSVDTLDSPYADPDVEELRGKLNELIGTLRR